MFYMALVLTWCVKKILKRYMYVVVYFQKGELLSALICRFRLTYMLASRLIIIFEYLVSSRILFWNYILLYSICKVVVKRQLMVKFAGWERGNCCTDFGKGEQTVLNKITHVQSFDIWTILIHVNKKFRINS